MLKTLGGYILARSGDVDGTRRIVREMEGDPRLAQRAMLMFHIDIDSMYVLFARAIDARDADAIWILNSVPFLHPLRGEPRYQRLLERMGLPPV